MKGERHVPDAQYDREGLAYFGWPKLAPGTYLTWLLLCFAIGTAIFWVLGTLLPALAAPVRAALAASAAATAAYPVVRRRVVPSASPEVRRAFRRQYVAIAVALGIILALQFALSGLIARRLFSPPR